MTTTAVARHWLERWDRQQEHYIHDREERFDVIADVLQAVCGRPDPLVVDLGCGPGSLAVRLLGRFPQAQLVGVDADPLLLGLAEAAHGDLTGLRLVRTDLRQEGWVEALDLSRPADAVVTTTALHWLTHDELASLFATCAGLLAPGGALVDGDHLFDAPARPRLDAVCRAVAVQRGRRSESRPEDWQTWWNAVGDAPELKALVGERGARPINHHVADVPGIDDYVRMLGEAGFAEVGTVWQHGDDRVLAALR